MSIHPQKKNNRPPPEHVEALHAAGISRNEIARRLGCTTRQVDNVARKLGISWDVSATRAAANARKQYAAATRDHMAERYRQLALDSLQRALDTQDANERRKYTAAAEAAIRADLALVDLSNKEEGMSLLLDVLQEQFRLIDKYSEEN